MVYVINNKNIPLMPCHSALARILIKKGQAKCIKRLPFTIKLIKKTTNYTQPIVLGVDIGSKTVGSSAVISNTGKVVYLSERAIHLAPVV